MNSLLNKARPPVFCPGCGHERIVHALDGTLTGLDLKPEQIVIVSDIGCSGLFDTFFNTHAFHGLHGRALTYATGIKMASPELTVIVTMGDGGLGIGGAHLLSTCRRNIDLTLLVLNNFNYGMTGGQCSATTPPDADVASGFLNRLEKPLDVCLVSAAAGAAYTSRVSAYNPALSDELAKAIRFQGFSLVDIWGICPGRFTKKNRLTPGEIEKRMAALPPATGPVAQNVRPDYVRLYREQQAQLSDVPAPVAINKRYAAPQKGRLEAVLLGSAGQRIVTAGELLCLAAMTAGLNATQKNDYPITVLRGHSISELVLADADIGYTGIQDPDVVFVLAEEGVARRKKMLAALSAKTLVFKAADVDMPPCGGKVLEIDFKREKVKDSDRALYALGRMAAMDKMISADMLRSALQVRFSGAVLAKALAVVETKQNQEA